jgi:hypothetical protein
MLAMNQLPLVLSIFSMLVPVRVVNLVRFARR